MILASWFCTMLNRDFFVFNQSLKDYVEEHLVINNKVGEQ